MTIIGISGHMKHGKTECAKILNSLLPNSTIINFADALKEEVSKATATPLETIEKEKDKFRLILQGWGTDFRRAKNPNYWVEEWIKRVLKSECDYVIVGDVRFLNEAEAIEDAGGQVWRVTRESMDEKSSHVSEHELDSYGFDVYFKNNGSIQALKDSVKILTQTIK